MPKCLLFTYLKTKKDGNDSQDAWQIYFHFPFFLVGKTDVKDDAKNYEDDDKYGVDIMKKREYKKGETVSILASARRPCCASRFAFRLKCK